MPIEGLGLTTHSRVGVFRWVSFDLITGMKFGHCCKMIMESFCPLTQELKPQKQYFWVPNFHEEEAGLEFIWIVKMQCASRMCNVFLLLGFQIHLVYQTMCRSGQFEEILTLRIKPCPQYWGLCHTREIYNYRAVYL